MAILINIKQHGFTSSPFCISALQSVYDGMMYMLDSNSSVDKVYLDFPKTFDNVDHGIPFHKLRYHW